MADAALGGLGAEPGPPRSRRPRAAVRAELAGRDLGADLAALIGDAYEELSSRCFEINVPTAVRSSAIGEDSGTASFAGIFDTYLGVSGQDRVLDAVRAVLGQPVQRARGGLPAAGGHAPPRHADGRRRHRADPRPGLRGGVLRPPGHREDRPRRHRDQLGLGRGGGPGPGHAGPRRGRQGRRPGAEVPGGGQDRGVARSTTPSAAWSRPRCRPAWSTAAVLDEEQIAGDRRRGARRRAPLRLPGRRGVGPGPAPPRGRARLRGPGPAGHRHRPPDPPLPSGTRPPWRQNMCSGGNEGACMS